MSKNLFEQMKEKESTQDVQWDLHQSTDLVPLEFTGDLSPSLFGIDEEKAQGMVSGLSTTISERKVLIDAYADVIQLEINAENLPTFKELRLKFVKNRTSIEKWHKTNKAFYLAGGRFVDAIKNKEVLEGQDIESKLMDAEKFFERQQAEITSKLNSERIALVEPYLESVVGLDLTTMDEYIFDSFLEGAKAKFETRIENERIETERIETERVEREKEIEAQRFENIELKRIADEKEKNYIAEQKERERLAKIESDKLAFERAENEAKLKAESEARAKIEAELKAKNDAEIKAISENNARIILEQKEREKLAKAPIKNQMNVWIDTFTYGSYLENETSKEILLKFELFKKWAKSEIEKL